MKKLVALVGMILSVGANATENSPKVSDAQKIKISTDGAKKVITSDELIEEIDLSRLEQEINPVVSIISRRVMPKSDTSN